MGAFDRLNVTSTGRPTARTHGSPAACLTGASTRTS